MPIERALLLQIKMSTQKNVQELFPWVTSSFVQNLIVKSELNKKVTLKSFDIKRCFDDGEGFSSILIGLNVVFEIENVNNEKQRDFILKIAILTEDYRKICEECLIYERETEAYTNILPAIEKLLESVGVPGQIAPR